MSMDTKDFSGLLKTLATATGATSLLSFDSLGKLYKPRHRNLVDSIFTRVSTSAEYDNLDAPTTRGIFNAANVTVTRPTKGNGWDYGFIINLAVTTGVQVWINFNGFIAVRGKGSSGSAWSEWSVMAKMT